MILEDFAIKSLYFSELFYKDMQPSSKCKLTECVQWQFKDAYNILNVLINIRRVK